MEYTHQDSQPPHVSPVHIPYIGGSSSSAAFESWGEMRAYFDTRFTAVDTRLDDMDRRFDDLEEIIEDKFESIEDN